MKRNQLKTYCAPKCTPVHVEPFTLMETSFLSQHNPGQHGVGPSGAKQGLVWEDSEDRIVAIRGLGQTKNRGKRCFQGVGKIENVVFWISKELNKQKTRKSYSSYPYAEQKTQKIALRRGTMSEIWQKQRFVPLRKSKNAENRSA